MNMSTQFDDLKTQPLQLSNLRDLLRADADGGFSESAPTEFFQTREQSHPCQEAPPPLETETLVHQRPARSEDPLELLRQHAKQEFGVGRLINARALSERRLALVRAEGGEASPGLPASFCDVGAIVLETGETEEAEWYFRQAAELLARRGHTDTLETAAVYNNLGVTARRRGDYGGAIENYEKALSIKIRIHGWEHRSVAMTLTNLARVEEMQGDLRSAVERYAYVRSLAERTVGSLASVLAASLMGLGRIYYMHGDRDAAHFAFQRALHIREAIICSPLQLAYSRFAYALVLGTSSASEARSLIARAVRDYQATDMPRADVLDRMRALDEDLGTSPSMAA